MEEAADELEAFVVGDVRRRLLVQRPAVQVVGQVRLDHGGRDSCAHRDGVDGHGDAARGPGEDAELAEVMAHALKLLRVGAVNVSTVSKRDCWHGIPMRCAKQKKGAQTQSTPDSACGAETPDLRSSSSVAGARGLRPTVDVIE